jgi:hypothetical protein
MTISEPESGNGAEGESQKVFLAGLPFTHKQISALFMRAKADMSLRPARFAIIGEYQECFTGEEFVAWLLENVPEYQRDLNLVVVAARDLTGRENLFRKAGEFGNYFDDVDYSYHQFRPKVLCSPS